MIHTLCLHLFDRNKIAANAALVFSTLSNFQNIKSPLLRQSQFIEGSLEFLRGLENVLLCENPRSPVHTKGLLTLGILEDVDSIMWISVRRTPYMAGTICPDGDQAEVEWAPELTHLLESRANGEVILWVVIIFSFGKLGYRSISRISARQVS